MTDILVVDDSLSMRYLVSRSLKEADYGVIVAEDGRQGLQRAQENQFDLIITDINMLDRLKPNTAHKLQHNDTATEGLKKETSTGGQALCCVDARKSPYRTQCPSDNLKLHPRSLPCCLVCVVVTV